MTTKDEGSGAERSITCDWQFKDLWINCTSGLFFEVNTIVPPLMLMSPQVYSKKKSFFYPPRYARNASRNSFFFLVPKATAVFFDSAPLNGQRWERKEVVRMIPTNKIRRITSRND